jgi:sortase A
MKKNLSNLLLLTVFLIGLSLLLYPAVSDYVNSRNQSRAIAAYQQQLARLSTEDYTALRAAADAYNARLAAGQTSFALTDEEMAAYQALLDPNGNGVMGYIEIESIGVSLPVYHGVEDSVLAVGAGHLPGSSLPVGGESTHCVLSGHRGLPSACLFTDLDRLQNGDVFLLHVLDETLAYEVDQILIVEPQDVSALAITPGEDYCTLVTCTPYGINTQRLLVRGHRIPYTDTAENAVQVTADAVTVEPLLVASVLAVPPLLVLLLILLCRTATPPKRKGKERRRP